MKKYILPLILFAALTACEEEPQQKTTLDSEWYFESIFPLHSRFVITKDFKVMDARVNYYSIPEQNRTTNSGAVIDASASSFATITIVGSNYRIDFINGVVRKSNPYFIDVERVDFFAPDGQKTTLDQAIVLKRIN